MTDTPPATFDAPIGGNAWAFPVDRLPGLLLCIAAAGPFPDGGARA